MTNVGEEEINIARAILEWYTSKEINIKWGTGAKIGTFYPTLEIEGKQISLFGVASNGKIEIYFQGYPLDHETKIQFIKEINGLGEISIPEKAADTWSSFPLSCLGDKSVLERFNSILEKLFT